jgi:hypothetical protein
VETASGVLSAAAAALANKLPAFRATREAAGGPLTDRKELGGMSV